MNILVNKCVYSVHPVYDLYASDENGHIIHIIKKVPHKGNKNCRGYILCSVKKYGCRHKGYLVHRFIWECFNGLIPEGKVIDHINNNKEDNRLCNLQFITPQQNCKKSAKDRDYSFISQIRRNPKYVRAINKNTNEVLYFRSMTAVQKYLGIHHATVKRVCEGVYGRKSGISKKDGCSYTFEYIKEEELPVDHIKSANIRPKRVSDEDKKKNLMKAIEKWQNKEFKCPNCNKTFKNSYKYLHKKHCKI